MRSARCRNFALKSRSKNDLGLRPGRPDHSAFASLQDSNTHQSALWHIAQQQAYRMKRQSNQHTSQVGPGDTIRKLSTQVQALQGNHPGHPPRLRHPELRIGHPLNFWAYDFELSPTACPSHSPLSRSGCSVRRKTANEQNNPPTQQPLPQPREYGRIGVRLVTGDIGESPPRVLLLYYNITCNVSTPRVWSLGCSRLSLNLNPFPIRSLTIRKPFLHTFPFANFLTQISRISQMFALQRATRC